MERAEAGRTAGCVLAGREMSVFHGIRMIICDAAHIAIIKGK
jgi:hypothetical protein